VALLTAALLAVGSAAGGSVPAEVGGTGPGARTPRRAGPSAEALVVRGIRDYQARAMRRGTQELEQAVTMRPDWKQARMAFATALLRNGEYERARAQFETLVGDSAVGDLTSGSRTVGELPVRPDPESLIGLGASLDGLGRVREAERLYRAAADAWGPTSRDSARAYHLLSLMFGERRVPWGDADAERAKAEAIDPRVADHPAVPPFPAAAADPELEPYTWPVAHTRTDPAHPAPGTPPALADWTAGRAEGPPAFEGTVRVEALIAEDGSVVEAEVVSPGDLAEGVRKAAIRAVAAAIFDPPASEDTSPSWVSIEIPGRALPPLAEPAEQIPQP
jgi:tetratricopeptide (TPR) repeat protein